MIESYENSLNQIINGEKKSEPSLPNIEELFESGKYEKIIDKAYYGRANGRGTKMLEELKKRTTLIKYDKKEIQRGSVKSDSSFTTSNDSYIFEYNNSILKVDIFIPRSRNKIIFNFKCD